MNTPALALMQPITASAWEDRPTGGALRVPIPSANGTSITLELILAHGRSFWFLHVLGVPFELDAGNA